MKGNEAFKKRMTKFLVDTGEYHIAAPPVCKGTLEGKIVLVTGANRGLGLGFVRHLAERQAVVIAACRNPATAEELNEILSTCGPGSFAVQMDLNDLASIQQAAETVASRASHVDVLLNNAGVSSKNHPNDPILGVNPVELMSVLQTNVVGTLTVTQTFLPLLDKGCTRVVMNLSSQLGSIDKCWGIQGRYGGVGSYRMSRAANNMMMRCFGGELREEGYTFVAMSPGHVNTDMGAAGGRKPPLEVAESVNGMLTSLENLTRQDNGKFLGINNDGSCSELPW